MVIVKVFELHAQPAAGHGVIFIALDLDQPPVGDLVDHGAGVRAIMRTGAEKHLTCWLFIHTQTLPKGFPTALVGR